MSEVLGNGPCISISRCLCVIFIYFIFFQCHSQPLMVDSSPQTDRGAQRPVSMQKAVCNSLAITTRIQTITKLEFISHSPYSSKGDVLSTILCRKQRLMVLYELAADLIDCQFWQNRAKFCQIWQKSAKFGQSGCLGYVRCP